MKTMYCNLIAIVLFLPTLVLGAEIKKMDGKFTEQKSIKKEFSVNPDALLKIDNSLGNLDVTSWNEDKVVIEINIKVNGNEVESVKEKLNAINVNFEASQERVFAKTIFNSEESSWWKKLVNGWNNNNLKMEINYVVKVPVTNSVDFNNDYGTITLDKIEGQAKIHCDYGQIIIGELLADNNSIHIDYTNNSRIKYMKSGKINADYADFSVESCGQLELNADYTKSKINKANKLIFNCDYGSLYIGKIGLLSGNGDYAGIDVERVSGGLSVVSDYGSISIDNIMATTQEVNIKTNYTGVRIGYEDTYNFNFRIKTSYGGVKILDTDVQILKKNQENTSKEYQGYRGDKNSGNTITISTSYGGVKLNKT